ncbi:MAG: hypothetical protein R3F61_37865 [Myxococcota bacterium]
MSFVLFLLLGCDAGETPCREGTSLHEDGHCYPPLLEFPPLLDDAVAALPECEPVDGGEEHVIDIARGCASGACADDTFVEMVEALGDEVVCVTTTFDNKQVYCTWEALGVDGLFLDDDRDTVPDANRRTDRIHLFPPYPGSTADGVGIGANVSCFIDSLGHPDRMVVYDVGGELMVRDLLYDQYGLSAYDQGTDDESGLPNGYVDNMYLYGAP